MLQNLAKFHTAVSHYRYVTHTFIKVVSFFIYMIELKNFKIMARILKYCFTHPLMSTIKRRSSKPARCCLHRVSGFQPVPVNKQNLLGLCYSGLEFQILLRAQFKALLQLFQKKQSLLSSRFRASICI